MNAVFQLRPVTVADVAQLSGILPEVLSGDWSATALHALLQSDHLLRVLTTPVQGGEAIVGFAECQQIFDEGHLLNIAIAAPWHRKGLGRVLLDKVITELARLGCTRCLLEVRRSNTPALRLYQRAGFGLDGIRKGYYPMAKAAIALAGVDSAAPAIGADNSQREDALLYSLPLSPS